MGMRTRLLALCFSVLALHAAHGQSGGVAVNEPGAWIPWDKGNSVAGPLEKELRALADVIRTSPVFTEIRGYYPQLTGSEGTPAGWKGPAFGTLLFEAWWPKAVEHTAAGPIVGRKWLANRPPGLVINVNRIPDFPARLVWRSDEDRFLLQPAVRREIAGQPVYADEIVITRQGKASIFAPVPQERVLRAYVKFIEPRVASARKRLAAGPPRGARDPDAIIVNDFETATALLQKMTAQERQTPAWWQVDPTPANRLALVPADAPGARPVVEQNPHFFDAALPRATMQLVTVRLDPFEDRRGARDPQSRIPLAVAEQTDWTKVQALLK